MISDGAVHDKAAARAVRSVVVIGRFFVNSVARYRAVVESGVAALDIYAGVTLKRAIRKRYVMIGSKVRAEARVKRICDEHAVFRSYGSALK